MNKIRIGKKRALGIVILCFVLLAAWFGIRSNITINAAGEKLYIEGSEWTGGEYIHHSKMISVSVGNNSGPITVSWEISDTKVISFDEAGNLGTSNQSIVSIYPQGIGSAVLYVSITDENGVTTENAIIQKISVPSAIMQGDKFDKIYQGAEQYDLVLGYGEEGKLEQLFKTKGEISWKTGNINVVAMKDDADGNKDAASNETGLFRATGTGKTTITLTYLIDKDKYESVVDVYVGPNVTINGGHTSANDTNVVLKGDPIGLGVKLDSDQGTITSRVFWILTDEKLNILDTSNSNTQNYLSSEPYSSNLIVTAKAGTYNLYVSTADIYQQAGSPPIDAPVNNISILSSKLSTRIPIKVLAEPHNLPSGAGQSISLQAGDSYDIASIFNLSGTDFASFFNNSFNSAGTATGTVTDGVFTAGEEPGTMEIELSFKDGVQEKMKDYFNTGENTSPNKPTIKHDDKFYIYINVYKGFTLDRSEAYIYVGSKLKLSGVYGDNMGKITWSSADTSFVTVNDNGEITGVKDSGGASVLVTGAMKLTDGKILRASCKVFVATAPVKIKLSESAFTMKVDDSKTITAKFEPSTIDTSNLQWLIKDEEVATVSVNSAKSAIITAKKPGVTILTVINEDNYIAAYCEITVISAIKTLKLDKETLVINKNQEVVKLNATYTPADATATELKWRSDNESVAKVDSNGLVSLVGPGTALITVIPVWNEYSVMAQCHITVIASPTGFALDKTSLALEVGDKATIKPILTAADSQTTITWTSMDTSVATVANGVVTAVAPGQTYIVANTKEGFVANCKVTVTKKASGITLTPTTIDIAVGETYEVDAKPNPANSTETKFTWTVKEPSVATVNDKGEVTGVSAGSTLVIVKTKSGDIAYLYVNVYDKAKGMTLNYSDKTVAKGKTFTLKPIFTPSNVTNKKVTWKSLKTSVATISDKGKVKGIRGGSAIITAVSDDGGYMATCLVTVVQPVSKVKLNYSSYKLGIGKTVGLKATVTSNSSSNSKVKWTSSNTSVASVSSSGKVKGKKLGTCTITARATDGSGKKATCKIRVVRQVSSISLNKPVLTLTVSQTKKLTAKVSPSNATYKTVKWTSSNKDVAVVDTKGNVTGLTVGTTTIKASAKDNSKESASCYVNVIDPIPASGIVVSAKDIILIRGQSQMISYTITPSNHTDKVTFASDNKAIATVTSTGKIYARRTGAATITITTSSGKQATINVTVIGLNKTSITLEQYDTETLIVDGVSTGITWYSSNPSIATVVGGKVVARKRGTCMIYATVSGITLSCRVTVKNISKS